MNPISAQSLKTLPQRGRRLLRALSAVLCIFLLTAMPVLAEPVTVRQVVQTISSSQGAPDLRVNSLVSQDPGKGATQNGPRSEITAQGGKPESIISGVTIASGGQPIGVDVDEEGEVEGTVCDCGEILVAGAAFPKWPFVFLAAVPLVFIHKDDCKTCDNTPESTPTPTPPGPTPTPTPPGVPEPASIFLFGTGIAAVGAGLRRRFAKAKQLDSQKEE